MKAEESRHSSVHARDLHCASGEIMIGRDDHDREKWRGEVGDRN